MSAPSEDSDQPGHLPSLIRVFAVRSVGSQGPNVSSCRQRRRWSDWADAQADLSLRWAHTHFVDFGERGGSGVECRTPEREVRGSRPTSAVLFPWARHFTPRKYWLITQEAMAPSRHDWKIVDWDVKPQHNQPTLLILSCRGSVKQVLDVKRTLEMSKFSGRIFVFACSKVINVRIGIKWRPLWTLIISTLNCSSHLCGFKPGSGHTWERETSQVLLAGGPTIW